ncbi:MAG: site-specific DNA-methyltransferase [Bacteroides sp.]|nr:site-specific DNA-methyltransferase [Ruminococcus flavefaciens]MCM1554752.1 site-specific DNA-methyltransferase [Bacteroides sp.]
MNKLNMKSTNAVDSNVAKIAALFPQCVTERLNKSGKPELAIDFDKLRAELSNEVLEEGEERYQFTWPDKRAASRLANTPSDMALRPCQKESAGKDGTPGGFDSENLYIEGDNLEVLKLLREDYLGKIKMIYIDPPYNTGNDFVYNDDYGKGKGEFEATSGFRDEEGNQTTDPMQRNTEANGRFHTDWLNMIYPRLKVARDLLSELGVILVSIDDNEIENLRRMMNEIFGESNFIAQMVWQGGKTNTARFISTSHEYILVFAKSLELCRNSNLEWKEKKRGLEAIYAKRESLLAECANDCELATEKLKKWFSNDAPEESKAHAHYCHIDERGCYCMDNVSRVGGGKYQVINPINGKTINPPSRGWVFGKEADLWKAVEEGRLVFYDNDKLPVLKRYLHDNETQLLDTVFYKDRRGAKLRLRDLMKQEVFDFPKDEIVVSNLIDAFSDNDDFILDFFSGSATTAHAVMKLNAEDGGHRKFIMVQLPEETGKDSEARKAGYNTICEIGKERIRRAGKKIKEENAGKEGIDKLDIGFRVLKLDSSNMEDVFYKPEDFTSDQLKLFVDNVKSDRTPLDLLFQVMPELNIELSAKVEEKEVNGKKVFFVDGNYLIATFDKEVNESTVTEIAKLKPQYFVMRDASAANDNVLDNFEQIFRHYSPETTRKIL